jgi:hypothetical protein
MKSLSLYKIVYALAASIKAILAILKCFKNVLCFWISKDFINPFTSISFILIY